MADDNRDDDDLAEPRRLIWVPILHTPEDMGRLQGKVRDAHMRTKGGRAGWDAYARAASAFWREARRLVGALDVDFARVRLYQDALPVCGYEENIVRELAHSGNANYRLLVDLMGKGAMLTGTEDPRLLVEEYELTRKGLEGPLSPEQQARSEGLLGDRDRFIAGRVEATLGPDETGLIFLGRAHNLEGLLGEGVDLRRLDPAVALR